MTMITRTRKAPMTEESVLRDWQRYTRICRAENALNIKNLHGQTLDAMIKNQKSGLIGGRPKREKGRPWTNKHSQTV